MQDNTSIGAKIRELRGARGLTLKQLSEQSGLSVGFLSQLERGMSSIAIDSLTRITGILGVTLSDFFENPPAVAGDPVVHGFEVMPDYIGPQILQFIHSRDVGAFELLPRVFVLLPHSGQEEAPLEMYGHAGEEFIYILEGVVTVYCGGARHTLYPGDSIQLHSGEPHNWSNDTGKIARLLTVNYPNPMK